MGSAVEQFECGKTGRLLGLPADVGLDVGAVTGVDAGSLTGLTGGVANGVGTAFLAGNLVKIFVSFGGQDFGVPGVSGPGDVGDAS